MNKKQVKFRDIINWKKEQITLLEGFLLAFGFALIGLGAGTAAGSMTGRDESFYVWVGWGITIIPFILIILRLGVFNKKEVKGE